MHPSSIVACCLRVSSGFDFLDPVEQSIASLPIRFTRKKARYLIGSKFCVMANIDVDTRVFARNEVLLEREHINILQNDHHAKYLMGIWVTLLGSLARAEKENWSQFISLC